MDCCTSEPRDGEIYHIPLKRAWYGDPSLWVVDGGNEECICLRKVDGHGPVNPNYSSIPRWRWQQMSKTNQIKYKGNES